VSWNNIIPIGVIMAEQVEKKASRPGSKWAHGKRQTLKQELFKDTPGFAKGASVRSIPNSKVDTSKVKT
jgi:hypothetical protein